MKPEFINGFKKKEREMKEKKRVSGLILAVFALQLSIMPVQINAFSAADEESSQDMKTEKMDAIHAIHLKSVFQNNLKEKVSGNTALAVENLTQNIFSSGILEPELIDDFNSPSIHSLGLAYDPSRNGVWLAAEDGNIYMFDTVSHATVKTITLVGKVMSSNGDTNGVEVLSNGNLLLADYNGDLATIDDYIFEFNPDTETMVNYWPLDGDMNTSTDGTNINQVIDVAKGSNGHTYVTSAADNNIYEIALVNGNPGTWSTVSVSPAPVAGSAFGLDGIDAAGFAVSDISSTTVAIVDNSSNVLNQFTYEHSGNTFNTGVTIVPGNPDQLWVTDFHTDKIGVFILPEGSTPKKVNMSPINYLLLD